LKQKVLVDTSSFVEYFRDGKESLIPALAMNDAIILSKVVRLELIKGAKQKDRKLLLNFLEGLIQLEEFPSADLVEKALLQLHGRGMNLGFADLLILADALRTRSRLLTVDKILARAAEIMGVGWK